MNLSSTDRSARRAAFEEQLKEKAELQAQELREQQEQQRIREENEIREIRKQTCFKATPIKMDPDFACRPVEPKKLTEAIGFNLRTGERAEMKK